MTSRPQPPPDNWRTFRGWHTESSLYRDIYTRTVSALIAAGIIYIVAAISGVVSNRPAALLAVLMSVVALGLLTFSVSGVIRHWRHIRPMFRVWDQSRPAAVDHYEILFIRFTFGLAALSFAGVLWIAVLVGNPEGLGGSGGGF